MTHDPDDKYLIKPNQEPNSEEEIYYYGPPDATSNEGFSEQHGADWYESSASKAEDVVPGIPSPVRVDIRKGFDDKGRAVFKALTTIQEVAEEHIYLVYRSYNKDVVVECDLLGDQVAKDSDGKLPPVIHLECPVCSEPDKPGTLPENSQRSMLSITHGNKHFEIEDLERKDWGVVTMPNGAPVLSSKGKPAIVSRRLTVKERIKCTYCGRSFKITDNFMSPA